MLPLAWWLQVANAAAILALGLIALAVARRLEGAPPKHAESWRVVGQAHALSGVAKLALNAFGAAALVAGEGSGTWNAFLRWLPAGNHGRNVSLWAFAVLLAVVALRRKALPPALAWGGLLLGLAAGVALGLAEGAYRVGHLANFAMLNTVLLVLLLCALALGVVAGTLDRLLALALAAQVSSYPLVSLWMTAVGEDGVPPVLLVHTYYLAFATLTAAIAGWRLRLARRGVPVPGLFPSPAAIRSSS